MKPGGLFLRRGRGGLTLIEMLVSMAIIIILLLALASVSDYTRKTWVYTTRKTQEFRGAQEGFETITRRLSQATLNTYWDYHYPGNNTTGSPDSYMRQSELRFLSGQALSLVGPTDSNNAITHAVFFQAPLGFVANASDNSLSSLLNTWGYFVEFGSDSQSWPGFLGTMGLTPHYRFRLMEMIEPSDNLDIYNYTSGYTGATTVTKNSTYTTHEWFTDSLNLSPRPTHILADNVIALVILPKLSPTDEGTTYNNASLAPAYTYDSTSINTIDPNLDPHNQLPPLVQVTMVAVDEGSYGRLQGNSITMPTAIKSALAAFQSVGDTVNPADPGYAQDLQTLQNVLVAQHINYRVFSTNVSLKTAKWSRSQTN